MTNTTAASKYIPKRPKSASIEIPLWFRPHFLEFSKTVSYEVNLTSQHSHLEVLLLNKFGSELMQILGLIGMYNDAVVVEVNIFFLLLFRLALAILCVVCARGHLRNKSFLRSSSSLCYLLLLFLLQYLYGNFCKGIIKCSYYRTF